MDGDSSLNRVFLRGSSVYSLTTAQNNIDYINCMPMFSMSAKLICVKSKDEKSPPPHHSSKKRTQACDMDIRIKWSKTVSVYG
jgi:hypothetical protein